MKNVTTSDRTTALDMAVGFGLLTRPVGEVPGIGKITVATGLNYSQVWCLATRHQIVEVAPAMDLAPLGAAAAAKPANADGTRSQAMITACEAAAVCRAEGNSWGLIGVRFNRPEGQVRRWFKEATGTKSEGLRNGKGGRWLMDEARLYAGDREVTGITLPAPLPRSEIRAFAARLDALENLPEDRKSLVALAKEVGVKVRGNNAALREAVRLALATTPEAVIAGELNA